MHLKRECCEVAYSENSREKSYIETIVCVKVVLNVVKV